VVLSLGIGPCDGNGDLAGILGLPWRSRGL
jgi:hypothetical protein